jgi:hypothetical protein
MADPLTVQELAMRRALEAVRTLGEELKTIAEGEPEVLRFAAAGIQAREPKTLEEHLAFSLLFMEYQIAMGVDPVSPIPFAAAS